MCINITDPNKGMDYGTILDSDFGPVWLQSTSENPNWTDFSEYLTG